MLGGDVGALEGRRVGPTVGVELDEDVGSMVGALLCLKLGSNVGEEDFLNGVKEGDDVGLLDGKTV